MSSVIKYAGVNAKVKAMIGKMLSEEDYNQLLRFTSLQDIFNYLYEHTFYRDALSEIAGKEIHRRQLERILKKSLINDYKAINYYLTGSSRSFFKYLFAKFEIEDLKMLLRTILIEHDDQYLKENLVYLGEKQGIPLKKISTINNYRNLLDALKDTSYHEILKRFEERYTRDKNLFPIEMTLDFEYFTRLAKLASRLSRDDYSVIRDLLGIQVNLLNINWIYRIKKFYDLEIEEILNYTLPYHYRLSEEDLKALVKLKDAEQIFNYLSSTGYHMLFSQEQEDKSILFEKYFLSYLLKRARHAILTGSYNIGIVSGYLFIKEYEIRDIITIVEGVRYHLGSEEIRNYLIRDLR